VKSTMRIGLLVGASVLLYVVRSASGYYDPGVQRWINPDPLVERGGVNLYSFARNNPLNLVDPDGRISFVDTPTVEDCSETEWTKVNQLCKKDHGEWWIAISCVKLTGRYSITFCGGKITLKLPVLLYICMDTSPLNPAPKEASR